MDEDVCLGHTETKQAFKTSCPCLFLVNKNDTQYLLVPLFHAYQHPSKVGGDFLCHQAELIVINCLYFLSPSNAKLDGAVMSFTCAFIFLIQVCIRDCPSAYKTYTQVLQPENMRKRKNYTAGQKRGAPPNMQAKLNRRKVEQVEHSHLIG